MSENQETLRLVQLFTLFREPEFVKSHSHGIEENGYKMFTVKTEISIPVLGKVIMASVYFPRSARAIPVLILNDEQNKILRKHSIRFIIRKRKHPGEAGKYYCFPSKNVFEKIISI